ncbi:MAG: C10 family peptidase [Candidatus Delongbacteria bacterium]|nr:C10 family peptidase [Candidatus Delongbacteria bacterium]
MKKFVSIAIIILVVALTSKPIQVNTAQNIALSWYKAYSANKTTPKVSSINEIKSGEQVDIFVLNMEKGFVLVAGDDASKPVLGYSLDQDFDYSDNKPNIKSWIDAYRTSIQEIRDNQLSNETTITEWTNILNKDFSLNTKDAKAIGPLMTTTWNQSPIYNDYCPLDGGSLSVVGCVATAMSQIMRYHAYPNQGDSESSYYCGSNDVGETLSVDYSLATYNWDEMPSSISSGSSSSQKHEVAQISYHAGVAVEMMYGSSASGGSGAYSFDVPYALETYFKYDTVVDYYSRSSYTDTQWHDLVIENLDNALPIYYSGQGPDGGHAFITDGYQTTEYFHFNWGWGGSSDGYYYLDNLNPGGYTFNDGHGIVKDIKPLPIDLTVDPLIEDMESQEDEIVIDLSNHFHSVSGQTFQFSIDPLSDINGLSHSISDDILTLTKTGNGLSRIKVIGSNRFEQISDEFFVKIGDPLPLSGLGNTYNLNASSKIIAGNDPALNSMEKLSVSMWLKLNQAGINQGVISKAISTSSGWYVQIQNNNVIKFSVKTQDGILRKIYSSTALKADQWYHLAVVFDGKDFIIYLDGEFDTDKTFDTASTIMHDESIGLSIGYIPGLNFDGSIDEVCLWNQPKSLDFFREVLKSKPSISDPDLVSYWNLDEGFSDNIMDMNNINNAFIENLNLAYWSNSTAPIKYFIERNTNADGVLPGDKDVNCTYSIVNNGLLGTMSILDPVTGSFEYTPDPDIFGVDTLIYKIDEDIYSSEEATIIINIKDGNSIDNVSIPTSAILHQNYPNPFNPETTISFSILEEGNVKLVVFDRMGRNIKTLSEGFRKQGNHKIMWNGKNDFGESVGSGVYYYMLKTNNFTDVKKALLIK